jgi:hypothetical protein
VRTPKHMASESPLVEGGIDHIVLASKETINTKRRRIVAHTVANASFERCNVIDYRRVQLLQLLDNVLSRHPFAAGPLTFRDFECRAYKPMEQMPGFNHVRVIRLQVNTNDESKVNKTTLQAEVDLKNAM